MAAPSTHLVGAARPREPGRTPRLVESAESELVAMLLPEVVRFLAASVHGAEIDRDGEIPLSVREGAARLGLFGMTIPAEYGGAGLSLGAAGRIVAEIARVDRSVAIMLGLHAGLGIRGLVEYGSADLRARWLPRLASGECIASFAATEAGAGSDLMAIRTTGHVSGGALRIDGEKSYVTNGGFAGLFTLLVRTPGLGGARAHSLVCVPAGTPGVQIGREEENCTFRPWSASSASPMRAVEAPRWGGSRPCCVSWPIRWPRLVGWTPCRRPCSSGTWRPSCRCGTSRCAAP